MPDRPESTASLARRLDDLPVIDLGAHPIREVFLAHLRPDSHAALVAPLDLFLGILLEGSPVSYLPQGGLPDPHDETAAVGRDLRFCAGYLRQIARAMFDELEYESVTVCRWCLPFAEKVDALAAELEEFIAGAPRPTAEESEA